MCAWLAVTSTAADFGKRFYLLAKARSFRLQRSSTTPAAAHIGPAPCTPKANTPKDFDTKKQAHAQACFTATSVYTRKTLEGKPFAPASPVYTTGKLSHRKIFAAASTLDAKKRRTLHQPCLHQQLLCCAKNHRLRQQFTPAKLLHQQWAHTRPAPTTPQSDYTRRF